MARLADLAAGYLEAAARLRLGIQENRARLESRDAAQQPAAQREVELLEKMLREVREVGDLARHYYEPAYWRSASYTC